MHVAQLWRYPVKSMAGERLESTKLGPLGIPGDRALVVVNEVGRIQTSRTQPRLLLHHATLDASGRARVDGLDWEDPAVAQRVRDAAGPTARLTPLPEADHFDLLPLLVATDGAIAAFGVDGRRFRPNLVIGGVDGYAERAWERRFLSIGTVVIGLHSLRGRCIMTTWDPDTLAQDVEVLKRIQRDLDGTFALNAWVARPGRIAMGDAVTLLEAFDGGEPPMLGRLAQPPPS